MSLHDLAVHRRETIGEQCYGPWNPAEYRKDSFVEVRDEAADKLNYYEVFREQYCSTESEHAALDHIISMETESDARLRLLWTKCRVRQAEERHGTQQGDRGD